MDSVKKPFSAAEIVKVIHNTAWPQHFIPLGTLVLVYKAGFAESTVVYNQKFQIVSNDCLVPATQEEIAYETF